MKELNAKVRCKECRRYITNSWQHQLRHAVKHHPERLIRQMSVCVSNPQVFQEMGAKLAQLFNARFRI